ncbi:hypothetical protein [Nocardia abscessus]|uniref:hypothetical protein n=1 Tax=Nocardia abscessus TaxID=120957 RepID=UPI002453816B|nr:hypothetical protein [Nocardia abscessus]
MWIAARARGGRALFTPATSAGVPMCCSVAGGALAATVAVPEIAVAVDNLVPGGVHAGRLSEGVVTASWIAFAAATSVVAAAAWPVVSRQNLRQIGLGIYGVGLFAVVIALAWSFTVGWLVVAGGCAFVVVTGLRTLDWTARSTRRAPRWSRCWPWRRSGARSGTRPASRPATRPGPGPSGGSRACSSRSARCGSWWNSGCAHGC